MGSSAFDTFPRGYSRWCWRRLDRFFTQLRQMPVPKCLVLCEKKDHSAHTRPRIVHEQDLWLVSRRRNFEWIHRGWESKDRPSFPCWFYPLYFDRAWPRPYTFFQWRISCWTVLLDWVEFHNLHTSLSNSFLSTELKLQWLGNNEHPNSWLLIPTWDTADEFSPLSALLLLRHDPSACWTADVNSLS